MNTRYLIHYLEDQAPTPPASSTERNKPAVPVQPAQQPVKTQAVVGNPPVIG